MRTLSTRHLKLFPALVLTLIAALSVVIPTLAQGNTPPVAGFGNSLDFDGSNEYVAVPYSAALNTNTFTVEGWVNTRQKTAYAAPFSSRNGTSVTGWNVYGTAAGKWEFWMSNNGWAIAPGPDVQTNNWLHIAVSYDGSTARLYIDGQEQASQEVLSFINNTSDPFRIGAADNGGVAAWFFNGFMDEVRVWSTARNSQQLTEYRFRTITDPTTEPGLVAYWDFNQSSGASLTDLTGSHTGNLQSMEDVDWQTSTVPRTMTVDEDQVMTDYLKASDQDADPLTFSIVDQPANGAVSITDSSSGSFSYTPDPDYCGADSFTYKVNDGTVDSNTATASISVNCLPPTLTAHSPTANTVAAPLTSSVVLTYSAAMSSATVTSRTVAIHSMMRGLVTETHSVNGAVVTVDPKRNFFPGELVYAIATTQTTDIIGTHPLSGTQWQFTAAAGIGPGTFPPGKNFGSGSDRTKSVAFGDVDGDGDLDLVAGNWTQQNVVYLNDGDGTFDTTSHNFGTGSDGTTIVALGDMDGDGDLDIVVGNGSSTPNRQSAVYLNDGDGTFDTTSHNFGPSDIDTRSVAVGDVDGDGDLDIVVGNSAAGSNNGSVNPQNVVYLNDGDGTFDTTSHNFGTDKDYTNSVALGDVDGDGDLDIVAAGENLVYLNDGDGTFDTTSYSFATTAWKVALGDVDGDGDLDIAVGNRGAQSQNVVCLNDGDGTFDTTSRNFGTGTDYTNSIALGDVDGDGNLDVIVGNYNEPDLVYPNNGDGTFATNGNYIGEGTWRIDANTGFAVGDVDGDGDLDIAVANIYEQNVVYANEQLIPNLSIAKTVSSATGRPGTPISYTLAFANPNTGVTTLAEGVVITDYLPVSVTNISIASSGATIIQTGNTPNLVWQVQNLNPGEGGVITLTGVLSEPLASGRFTNTATITNTNDDSDPANNSAQVGLTVVQNIGPTAVDDQETTDKETALVISPLANDSDPEGDSLTISTVGSPAHGTVTFSGTTQLVYTPTLNYIGPEVFTYTISDGRLSDTATITVSVSPPKLIGFSPLANAVNVPLDSSVVLTYSTAMSSATVTSRTVAIHSMMRGLITKTHNTNGAVVTVEPNYNFFPGEPVYAIGTTRVTDEKGMPPYRGTAWQFTAATGEGPAIFNIASNPVGTGDGTYAVAFGDVDGDGDLDLAVGNGGPNMVYLNDGDGTFDTTSNPVGSGDGTYAVAFGDVDSDGDLDLAVGNYYGQNVIYLNDGDGTFDTTSHKFDNYDGTYAVAFGDVDGDGDLDLAVGNSGQQNVIYLNNGDGTFDTTSHNFGPSSDATYAIAFGDVDGDGDLDLAVGNSGGQNVLYLNDGDGTFDTTSRDFGTGSDYTNVVVFGDVDGDGDLDIAVGNSGEQGVVYLNDGDGTFDTTSRDFGASSDSTKSVALGDVDGDGDLDIAMGISGYNKVVLNQSFPDVGISKTVSSASARPGHIITYTLVFSNAGWETATGVVITDSVPVSVTNISVISSGAVITQTGAMPGYVWQVGGLAHHQTGIITITGVLSYPLASGTFTNTATITTTDLDTNPANNSAIAALTVVQNIAPVAVDDPVSTPEDTPLTISPLANDTDVENDPLSITHFGVPAHGAAVISGTTAITYTPNADWLGTDSFTYTVSDGFLTDTATITVTVQSQLNIIYLPLIAKNFVTAPDLVITSLVADGGGIAVTMKNQGNAAVTDAFWLDVYFNPARIPVLNEEWEDAGSEAGAVWGVTTPIPPGGELTLTVGDNYYDPSQSSSGSFPANATVYGYVDSINWATSYGAVYESDESNNLFGPVTSGAGSAAALSSQGDAPPAAGLPQR